MGEILDWLAQFKKFCFAKGMWQRSLTGTFFLGKIKLDAKMNGKG